MGHPERVRALMDRIRAVTLVRRAESVLHPVVTWLAELLRPHLAFVAIAVAAMVVVGATGWGLAETFDAVVGTEGIARLDRPVARWFAAHRTRWLTDVMGAVSAAGGATGGAVAIVAAGLVGWRRGRTWRPVLVVTAALVGAVATSQAIKDLVGRPRPSLAVTTASGFAFPSGHTTTTVAVAGAVAWLVARHRRWHQQVTAWAVAVFSGAVVGFSRAYLGAHWLTDIVGGWLLGTAWLAVVMASDAMLLLQRSERPASRVGQGAVRTEVVSVDGLHRSGSEGEHAEGSDADGEPLPAESLQSP